VALPLPPEAALDPEGWRVALARAEGLAAERGVRGPALTPFLLARLAELTRGRTLHANRALVVANARLAAEVAVALAAQGEF
jgi:pseudouridine-5'-phosphate glycosidase